MPIVETSTDAARPVEVVIMDDAIEVDATVAPEGDVRFALTNRGEHSHDFVVAAVADGDTLPIRDGRVREERVDVAGRVARLGAGERHDAVFQLRQGRYLLFSNAEDDFERGLRAELTVQPPEPYDRGHYEESTGTQPPA